MHEHKQETIDFQSSMAWSEQRSDTLVIHCSDHRFQPHFDELLHKMLQVQSFDRLVVPGGPHFLVAASILPKFEWAGRRWLKYLVKNHGVRQLICLAHDNCGWYRDISVGSLTIPLLRERQLADLRKIPASLGEYFPGMGVRVFYGWPDSGRVNFSEIK